MGSTVSKWDVLIIIKQVLLEGALKRCLTKDEGDERRQSPFDMCISVFSTMDLK